MGHTEDDTIFIRRPKRRGRGVWLAGGSSAIFLLAGGLAFLALRGAPAGLPLADVSAIEEETPDALSLHRFAANPRILILDFPDLQSQGRMFNRVAAFAEKAGAPRDRILIEAELAAQIAAGGDTSANYYYGHDYDSQTLARFFATATRDRTSLNPQEQQLRALCQAQGLLEAGANQAIITLPRLGADATVDALFRHTILTHELSHGEYFTRAAYHNFVVRFWHEGMDQPTQDKIVAFLRGEAYDLKQPDLIMNEAQAYLIFTPDTRVISASRLNLPSSQLAQLRASFLANMPSGWLRDMAICEPTNLGSKEPLDCPASPVGKR